MTENKSENDYLEERIEVVEAEKRAYKQKIEEARGEVAIQVAEARKKAYRPLLDIYFDKIVDKYSGGDNATRNFIETRLEIIINSSCSIFDGELARKLRSQAGFSTQRKLAKHIETTQQTVCRFEREKGCNERPPNSKKTFKYLIWLKEQGYNPYDL